MKTSNILTLALIGIGVYYIAKAYSKKSKPPLNSAKRKTKKEATTNATGFEIPKSGNKVFTQYGML